MIKIAFFASHPLGMRCLELLHKSEELDIEIVVTYPPDHDTWWENSVHSLAQNLEYPILPIHRSHELFEINNDFDYIICVYYPNILNEELLELPEKGALNLHQAELPRFRGSNVFTHSILRARRDDHWVHGTTFHFMTEKVDAGDIVGQKQVQITENDTAWSLYKRTNTASVQLFKEMIPAIASGKIQSMRTPQSAYEGPRYFNLKSSLDDIKKISLDDLTNENKASDIWDRIRALEFPPFEPAYTQIDGNKIYLTTQIGENNN